MGLLLGSGRHWLWDGSWAVGGVGYGMAPGQWEVLAVGGVGCAQSGRGFCLIRNEICQGNSGRLCLPLRAGH